MAEDNYHRKSGKKWNKPRTNDRRNKKQKVDGEGQNGERKETR